MPLFERGYYKKEARAELEKSVRELEEKAKKEQSAKDFNEKVLTLNSNLTFAVRINLISEALADEYRERIKKAAAERLCVQNAVERQEILKRQSNVTEHSVQGVNMAETQAIIEQLRAERNAKQAQQANSEQSRSSDEERVK